MRRGWLVHPRRSEAGEPGRPRAGTSTEGLIQKGLTSAGCVTLAEVRLAMRREVARRALARWIVGIKSASANGQ